jgi:hypothetical protein
MRWPAFEPQLSKPSDALTAWHRVKSARVNLMAKYVGDNYKT